MAFGVPELPPYSFVLYSCTAWKTF